MWFFGKTKAPADPSQPKRQSTFGMLFNPNIGDSLRPLGETTNVFVQIIAMIFAMNGLFPKDHPALQGVEGAKLSLSQIFSTAWNNLSFTKQGMPKVILFFAVTGAMIFAMLSVVTALIAGFMGSAHAQGATSTTSSSFFSPINSTEDLAQNWLNYLFQGQPLSSFYGLSSGSASQSLGSDNSLSCALMTALGTYSNAKQAVKLAQQAKNKAGIFLRIFSFAKNLFNKFDNKVRTTLHIAHEAKNVGKLVKFARFMRAIPVEGGAWAVGQDAGSALFGHITKALGAKPDTSKPTAQRVTIDSTRMTVA